MGQGIKDCENAVKAQYEVSNGKDPQLDADQRTEAIQTRQRPFLLDFKTVAIDFS
jgi:hypothetical protein